MGASARATGEQVSDNALSKERIAELVAHVNATSASPPRSFKIRETILALIEERARLREQHVRDRIALNRLCDYFDSSAETADDRWEMKRLLDAWKAGT
jgi:hypothetical protein